jgi:hypothetical protein
MTDIEHRRGPCRARWKIALGQGEPPMHKPHCECKECVDMLTDLS